MTQDPQFDGTPMYFQARNPSLKLVPHVYTECVQLYDHPDYEVFTHTHIGDRACQEDRFVACPRLLDFCSDVGFFGVFDGTVGDFASESVKNLIIPSLLSSDAWNRLVRNLDQFENIPLAPSSAIPHNSENVYDIHKSRDTLTRTTTIDTVHGTSSPSPNQNSNQFDEKSYLLQNCMDALFDDTDTKLLSLCRAHNQNYASTTAVVLLLVKGYACIGHLGDSRLILGFESNDTDYGMCLTEDHKPNAPQEEARIIKCGGTVEYLQSHNNKPFIRGGDFVIRRLLGDTPMQLQYSRAFGGKDLKRFGLSSTPTVRVMKLSQNHKVLILASDGIWDIMSGDRAVQIVVKARTEGHDPAKVLIDQTVAQHRQHNTNADNLTVIVVILKTFKSQPYEDYKNSKQISRSDT